MPEALISTATRAATLIGQGQWYEAVRLLTQSKDPELAVAAHLCQDIAEPNEDDKRRVLDLLKLHDLTNHPPTNVPE